MHEDWLMELVAQLSQGIVVVKMYDVNDVQSIETLFVNAAAAELMGDGAAANTSWPKSVLTAIVDALVTGKESALYNVEMASSAALRADLKLKPLSRDKVALLLSPRNPVISMPDSMPMQEARFRKTFENAAVGIAHVGLDGSWLQVNQQMCDIVGRTRAEMLQTTFQAITHPDDLDADLALYEQLKQGEISSYQMEKRYVHKDGHVVWVNLTTTMERAMDGAIRHCIAVVHDISERKVVEARLSILARASTLLASSLDYKQTLRQMADFMVEEMGDWCGIDILEENGQILRLALASANPDVDVWTTGMNLEPLDLNSPSRIAQVIRTGEALFIPEVTDEMLENAVTDQARLASLRSLNLRSSIIVPLVTRSHIMGALTLVRSENSRNYTEEDLRFTEELAQRAAIAIDNARLYESARQSEAELRAINDTLEQRIRARTQDLERSNRELQEFAYVASHDLQEPLRKVLAFSDRLEQRYSSELGQTGADYIARMQQSATRMQRLINDLLALSRITTGGDPFEAVDLNQTIEEVIEDLSEAIKERSGRVIAGNLPIIQGDPSQLHQLFQNLIANALKFAEEGTPPVVQIEVVESPDSLDRTQVQIAVADNGIGFEQSYADRIFQPFQRLHGRNTYLGTGMGLAICRRIVERHGGQIQAVGVPDGGAIFTVTLPLA